MTINYPQDLPKVIEIYNKKGIKIRLKDCYEFKAKFYVNGKPNIYTECYYSKDEQKNVVIQPLRDLCISNADDMKKFSVGSLMVEYIYSVPDDTFPDGLYNAERIEGTKYYINMSGGGSDDTTVTWSLVQDKPFETLDNQTIKSDVNGVLYADITGFATTEYVDNAVQAEQSARQSNDALLKADIQAETDRAKAAESVLDGRIGSKADADTVYTKDQTYTKAEVNTLIDSVEVDLSDYAKTTYVDTKVSNETDRALSAESQLQNNINLKANATDVYNIVQTYNKTEVNTLIAGVEVDLSNYYTKQQVYNKPEIDEKLEIIDGGIFSEAERAKTAETTLQTTKADITYVDSLVGDINNVLDEINRTTV